MPTISPVLRITIGLLLLTVSLLLIGDLLGIVPNQKQSEIDARKVMAESLAIQVTSEISGNRIKQTTNMLNAIVKRNEHIQSIALRKNTNQILMQSDRHKKYWKPEDNDQSSATHVLVPIYSKNGRWGTLEVSFMPLSNLWDSLFESRSFSAMLFFILIIGFITYWLFLRRVLSELDPSSVVPDRVRSALDVLTEGLVMVDTNERIILVNTAFKNKLGYLDSDLIGKQLSSLPWKIEQDNLSFGNEKLPWNALLEDDEIPKLSYLKLESPTQDTFTFDVNVAPIKAPNQKIKGVIITIDDVTELEKKNSELNRILERLEKSQNEINRQNIKLRELATQDPLTQVLNRRSLFEGMNNLLDEAHYQDGVLSCILIDIDFFKLVNDTFGHIAGDKVIKIIAETLQVMAGPDDLVGRYGGEEFVIVMPGLHKTQAKQLAEKIRLTISELKFDEISKELQITSSFGVNSTENNVWETDQIIDQADQALYIAKQSGRNQVIVYSEKSSDAEVTRPSTTQLIERRVEKTQQNSDTPVSEVGLNDSTDTAPVDMFQMAGESSRTVILDRLSQAQRLSQRNNMNIAVLTIFIDTIQLTNNTLGYASAEKLKKIAYTRLIEIFRLSDSVIPEVTQQKSMSLSRSSDSEFTAILTGIEHAEDTTWAIFRMFKELSVPVAIDGNEIVMTANIGASLYPGDGEHPEELLNHSKMALHNAIEEGRGSFLFYNQEMNSRSKQVLRIESQLHQAIEREELYLNFQPIINMETAKVEKVEALIRWNHPEFGIVPPDTFIQIAEHTGNIKTIGKWVMRNACRQLKVWQKQGYPELTASVNLSPVQFYDPNLAEVIVAIVEEEGISPESILLELTETALVKQHDEVFNIISQLHTYGFKIALDDFGTGYSSLEYLHKFPIHYVKMDRSLMHNFPEDVQTVSIVSGIISLCHNLGIRVITEGVENEAQLLMLRDLKCDEIQGYLLSKPLYPKDMTEYFDSTASRQLMRKIHNLPNDLNQEPNKTSLGDILNNPPA